MSRKHWNNSREPHERSFPAKVAATFFLLAENEDAEPAAYALAANAWERGVFDGVSLEEVRFAMKSVLRKAYYICPSCSPD